MKSIILFLMALLVSPVLAQKWQKVDQKYYGMKYELPAEWEIDGFGWDDDWEHVGSSVCDCSGTINIGNRWEENEIYMVVFPTRHPDSLDAVKRTMVWDMRFEALEPGSPFSTEYCHFERTMGRWEDEDDHFSGNEVWKLTASAKNQHYVFYFWARPEVMMQNEKTLYRILESFQPVKAR